MAYSQCTVSELPIFNRRFTNFELLTPGVQAVPGQIAPSEDPQGSYRKVVNGQSFAGTTHLLDGTDNHDVVLGLIVINPTLESVTDGKVSTQNYDAEFGASAGVVSAQTRPGTKNIHGSLFWFTRNSETQASNPFTQSRNPVWLALLRAACVRSGNSLATFNFTMTTPLNVNGGRKQDFLMTFDGAVAVRTRANGTSIGVADVDTVQEMQILTANYDAEYGRSARDRCASSPKAAVEITTSTALSISPSPFPPAANIHHHRSFTSYE